MTPTFASNWRGSESAKSNAVTVAFVDESIPVNTITRSLVTGNAVMSGDTIFYRGVSAGSFRLINAVTEEDEGAASSATATLAGTTTGWTHSPSTVATPTGGPYVSNLFSWSAGTTSAPTEVVTGTDLGGGQADTTLSFVNDSTAPTAGSITYAAGYQAGRSVTVTFAAGTDSGSGLGAPQLQRSYAPLTAGSCGTYSSFANLGQANPASPYTDSQVTNGVCYKYRYVVPDLVGNQDIATSTNVVMVDYAGAVNATTGLLSQWRLGEATTSSDTFTNGASGDLLPSRAGEIDATWVHLTGAASTRISAEDRVRRISSTSGYSIDYTTATPLSADYSVAADLYAVSNISGNMAGVIGRLDTATTTFYMARWEQANTSWNLVKYSGTTATNLASVAASALSTTGTPNPTPYRVRLSMVGPALKLYVNGVLTLSATDSAITSAGKAGIMSGKDTTSTTESGTTGYHLDNFQVTPRAADSKGSNPGDYFNGVTLSATGALAADANTAAAFDGTNDYVQAVGTTGIPVGASLRSVEMWFKTTSATRQVLFAYGTLANTQEFGLWLDAGGASMTAWGSGSGNDKTFTLASAVNNGAWHQVVKTYDGTSITLYIDGTALTPQAATRATVMDSYGFGIGAIINPGDANSGGYFNGSLDEVSFYTTSLDQTTVTSHYQLGTSPAPDLTGPTGGSVAASGLVGTGSMYAASTTLSLSLAKGTDTSGVATTGNQLLRATATLTSGTCGSYGTFTLIADGTDPASPKSDTVADQACYKYQYVVADTLGNPTTYTSADIKVDTTAPAAPSLTFGTFTNTYWSSGSTVFYRSAAASGTFRATASASDAASGIASYGFPTTLGTNWSTTGSGTQRTYSWSGAPAAPGTNPVTATNNATGTSPGTSFTLTADDTAPSPGTVSYLDGTTTSTSVSVAFTSGTDTGGSGIATATRVLQRASATLTGGTCGSFLPFATRSTNPTSPYIDTVSGGNCYKYQYVVQDNVGNPAPIATSASVVTVPTYLDFIKGTTGLVSHWRLGDSLAASDSFTDAAGVTVQSHTGEIGSPWTKHAVSTTDAVITTGDRIRKNGSSTLGALYYSSAVPASANYTVEADVYRSSTSVNNDVIGIVGRLDTANALGTYYGAVYDKTAGNWVLYSMNNGAKASLGTYSQSFSGGSTYRVSLDMTGSTIRLLVGGTQRVSVTNTTITAAGSAGVIMGFGASTTTVDNSNGMHLDNFTVSGTLADSWGTNTGSYLNGPTLGVAGAITGDSNTAVTFDGSNDYATVARQISNDFSIEFWFKSTNGNGTNPGWWQGSGLVDAEGATAAQDFGISLRSDGRIVAGVGSPSGGSTSVVSSTTTGDNGSWHHVVFTRIMSTGAMTLYVDGASAGTALGSTTSLTSATNIDFGRILTGPRYFSGTLDEVAVYNTVLSAATVTDHNNAGR